MEMGNGRWKMGVFLHNYMPSLHSATPSEADFLINTQKSIVDRPEWCGCVTSHHTGRQNFLAQQASRAAILAIILEYPRLLAAPCFWTVGICCLQKYAAAGVQQNLRKTLLFKCCLLVATFTRVWPCCSYYVLHTYTAAWSYYGKTISYGVHSTSYSVHTLFISVALPFCFHHKQLILPSTKQRIEDSL